MSNKSGVASQVLPLPQGGGALTGIGESFSPDIFTGTGSLSIPIALPPGRNGFQPELSLTYSTGAGNGAFGLGWNLNVPAVTRKTSKGLPRYRDRAEDPINRDTFILSHAEDLVQTTERDNTGVARFRPRTEGAFAEIEHVLGPVGDSSTNFWRVRATDGGITLFGTPVGATSDTDMGDDPRRVIANPAEPANVFAWMLSEARDPFGNVVRYSYRRDRHPTRDTRRGDTKARTWDQLYLERISYVDLTGDQFLVSVVFVYDETERPDAFSSHRSGFEIRTRLRCRRIEISADAVSGIPQRTYELTYADDPSASSPRPRNGVSLLSRVDVVGHVGGTQRLPPLDLGYTAFADVGQKFQPLSAAGGALPAKSLAHADHELVDLYGRGLPDVVEMTGLIRFWRNIGDGSFIDVQTMESGPQAVLLSDPGVRFADLDGNGRADLLVVEREGYFPMRFGGEFFEQVFVDTALPSFTLEDGNTRFVDLNGDGVVDALRTEDDFVLFFNRAEERRWDSEPRSRGPIDDNLRFASPTVKLADLSGDGLQDFVHVDADGNRRLQVRYWPNLGDGRFGSAVAMANGPEIRDNTASEPLGFEPTRLLLADVDGDGLDDLLYIHLGDAVLQIWINQSGSGWSLEPLEIPIPEHLSFVSPDAIRLEDLLGTGTAGVLWTSDRQQGAEDNYQFLDLTAGTKPYLLTEVRNNMGAVTRVGYAPSTAFYLTDQQDAKTAWRTPLAFPVQVVARVEVFDELSQGQLTSTYRYHHGYWDGAEREFRGFGMVEQLDTEVVRGGDRVDDPHVSPPTLTKTWFHLGDIDDETLKNHPEGRLPELDLTDEYFQDDPPMLPRPDDLVSLLRRLPTHTALREALRSLRGRVLRTELYSVERSVRPFTVTETLVGLREEDSPGDTQSSRARIFFPHILAQRTTNWDGGTDPMTRFTFSGDYDAFGHPRRQTDVACPRGWRGHDDRPGRPYLATSTQTVYAQPQDADVFLVDRAARTTSFEMVNDGSHTVAELLAHAETGSTLAVIGQEIHFYDGPAFVGLPNGEVGRFGRLVRTETLALTEDLLNAAYRGVDGVSNEPTIPPYLTPTGAPLWTDEYPLGFRDHLAGLSGLAGYTFYAGDDDVHVRGYFAQSAQNEFDFQRSDVATPRGMLRRVRDPLRHALSPKPSPGRDTTIDYDEFDLLPIRTTDPVGLVTRARHHRHLLRPVEIIDPNDNRTQYVYTPLGLVAAIAVLGKDEERIGDEEQVPDGTTRLVPSTRFEYDFEAFVKSPADARVPIWVQTVRRVHHVGDPDVTQDDDRDRTIECVEYTDGFGRPLQTRTLAEDKTVGDAIFGVGVLSDDQAIDPATVPLRARGANAAPNVVVDGARIYDNKGRVIAKFEPYFELESGFAYRPPGEDRFGQQLAMFYDPLGRLIRTVHPDGAEQRVVYGVPGSIEAPNIATPDVFEPTPWESYTYDANDLAPLSRGPSSGGQEGPSLIDRAPRHHHFTPSSSLVDAHGRTVLAIARNREVSERDDGTLPELRLIETRSEYDVRGNLLGVVDALRRVAFSYVYDLNNNTLRTDHIDNGVQRVVLDAAGNEVERRDAKGAVILRAFDQVHRPTRLWAVEAKGSGLGDDHTVTLRERLEYGDVGELDTNRALNRLGVLHRHYDEAGLLEIGAYDFKGNVLEQHRHVIRDDAIMAVFPDRDPEADWRIRAFRVDWHDVDDQASRLLEAQPHEISSAYDALNRVRTVRYPRDVEDQRRALTYAYNRGGTIQRVLVDGIPFVEHIGYDAKGRPQMMALANGVMTLYAYDPRSCRLRRQVSTRFSIDDDGAFQPAPLTTPEARKANLHQDLAYDYDLSGNTVRQRDRTPDSGIRNATLGRHALDRVFDYDALYRLVAATGREVDAPPDQPTDLPFDPRPRATDVTKARAYRERYRYDDVGNLQELHHTAIDRRVGISFVRTYEHRPGTNQLVRVSSAETTFDYGVDPCGNVIAEHLARHFEWDHANRMRVCRTQTTARDGGGEGRLAEPSVYTQYLYDAGGMRIKKVTRRQGGAVAVTEYVDGLFEVDRVGDVTNSTLHVLGDGTRLASVRVGPPFPSDDPRTAIRFIIGDQRSDVTVRVDADGDFIDREEYSPYGDTTFGSAAHKRYRFTGQERDDESGLYYHGARYYAPWLGRWMSTDPAGPRDGPNLYVYVRGNPIGLIDPTGREGSKAQLWISEAKVWSRRVVATTAGRGFTREIKRYFRKLDRMWGAPSKWNISHVGRSQWQIPAGGTGVVHLEEVSANLTRSVGERTAAQAAKAAGQFGRVNNIDPTGVKGGHYGPAPLDPLAPTVHGWNDRGGQAATVPRAAAEAPTGVQFGPSRQLSLPFPETSSGSVKGVEVGTPSGGQRPLPGGAAAGLLLGTVRGALFLEGVAKVLHAGMGWDLEAREQGPFRLTREQQRELEAERREARLEQAERRLEAVRRQFGIEADTPLVDNPGHQTIGPAPSDWRDTAKYPRLY